MMIKTYGAILIGAAVAIISLATLSFGIYWVFAPASVAVQNRVFHQSQAYNDGMARDLDNLRMQYNSLTDANAKAAVQATVLHRFAGYDASRLPADLQVFLESMRRG